MKVKYFLSILFLTVFFNACGKKNKDAFSTNDVILNDIKQEENKIMQHEEEMDRTPIDSTTFQTGRQQQKNQTSSHIDWDKKIIRTAQLSVEVKEYKKYTTSLNTLVKRFGSYIATEQEVKDDARIENKVRIKVPVAEFQELMNAINSLDEKITERQISSEDVTTEVIDTKSRIEAKKQIRQRYLDFLKQAKSMQDILSIQSEINEVQEEIEMAVGRVEYLNHSSSYSTIDLYYYQILKPSEVEYKPGFGNKILQAFSGGLEIIKGSLIVLITVWPIWVVAIVIFLFIKRRKLVS